MRKSETLSPLVFNLCKPARQGSFELVRQLKRALPGELGKLGHFGTLDPFACGVLLVGAGGAARLNDLIHSYCPKTYLAVGRLGRQTDTGDWQGQVIQQDESRYLREVISAFSSEFIHERLQQRFVGSYWQTPPQFSATKYQGRPLHQWAREGVVVKKEPVKRTIYRLEVVRWSFPYLSLRAEVSSGTYLRTLFEEAALELGTIGSLIALQREKIGAATLADSLRPHQWSRTELFSKAFKPEELLPFPRWSVPEDRERAFANGLSMRVIGIDGDKAWAIGRDGRNWGLLRQQQDEWKVTINFRAMSLTDDGPLELAPKKPEQNS